MMGQEMGKGGEMMKQDAEMEKGGGESPVEMFGMAVSILSKIASMFDQAGSKPEAQKLGAIIGQLEEFAQSGPQEQEPAPQGPVPAQTGGNPNARPY